MALVPSFIPNADSINGAVSNFFGEDAIDAIRSIDYDTKYLWCLKWQTGKPAAPFNGFFPANTVSVPMAISEAETIEYAQTSVQVPIKTTGKEITITFYDDTSRTLMHWLSDWVNIDIQNDGRFISGTQDNHTVVRSRTVSVEGSEKTVLPVRQLQLSSLSKYKKVDKTIMYDVFPIGNLDFEGDHSSEAQTYTVRFAIVKQYGISNGRNNTSFESVAKDILGRLF